VITRCPQCHAWFRVRADHLSAANGFVTCGECDAVFNALGTLIEGNGSPDTPPPGPAPETAAPTIAEVRVSPARGGAQAVPDPSGTAVGAPPAPDADDTGALDAAPPDASAEEPAGPMGVPPDPDLDIAEFEELLAAQDEAASYDGGTDAIRAADDAAAYGLPEASLSPDEHAILFTEPGAPDEVDTVPEYLGSEPPPAVLQSDLAALAGVRGRRGLSRALWKSLAVLAFAAAALQLAWIYRDRVTTLLPAAIPVVATLCDAIRCNAANGDDPQALRLLARDVREHPQYHEALLVNATMVNEAPAAEPFPVIELSLHDAAGNVLGARRFRPSEYLDESIAIDEGMPPDRPIYIVMELGGNAHAAVSFEFRFL
jgi:predicted Zn finger-like uncharacterized protein